MPQDWYNLASDARRAAAVLVQHERYRSAVARAYYAAYSKVTFDLVNAGATMPPGREGPSHTGVRRMIESGVLKLSEQRELKLSQLIGQLYALRIYADYRPSIEVDAREARQALSIMTRVFDSF